METNYSRLYWSPVGLLLVSGRQNHISGLHFIEEDQSPPAESSQKELPEVLLRCLDQLAAYFEGRLQQFDIPILQESTPFQNKVWQELTKIPYGKTITYLEQSRRVGNVKAIRAVASANGKNNISIIVPCHRVIGSKNELVGYGGGLWRKKWLLDHEARFAYGIQTLF
jgi:methylated-DNA-[protein]-cysteine S-methyltransferase